MYRISKIKTIEETAKTFHKNYEISDFIKDMQTPFSFYRQNYKRHLINIKLEVSKDKVFFFKSKQYLKSQNIEKTLDNGNIIVNYKVTQEREIEELIKRWIPHVKVLEPASLRYNINDELKKYLNL
jgi:predicted DNA-binding transcriptional regulator YafY